MELEVFDKSGSTVCSLTDDTAILDSFPIANEMRLHVRIGTVHDTHMCFHIHNVITLSLPLACLYAR